MQLVLTPLAEVGVTVLPPDIVWSGTVGDFAVASSAAEGGVGSLVARNPLASATLMLLFTDARPPKERVPDTYNGDRRGWVGDGFDIDTAHGETPLGSYLWLYRRSVLSPQVGMEIEFEVKRALKPLIDQGAAVRVDAKADIDEVHDLLKLKVDLYGRDGASAFSVKFDPLWRRVDGGL